MVWALCLPVLLRSQERSGSLVIGSLQLVELGKKDGV